MKSKFTFCIFLVTFAFLQCLPAFSQTPKKPAAPVLKKWIPPVTKTALGKYTGNTAVITAAEGKELIKQPLTITDDKNYSYKVSSYQFAYKRRGVTEDEATGKTSPATDIVAQRFSVTPLPELWVSNIEEQLRSGEEFIFFDVIVFDKIGRLFFAPELKITIQ